MAHQTATRFMFHILLGKNFIFIFLRIFKSKLGLSIRLVPKSLLTVVFNQNHIFNNNKTFFPTISKIH